jgi:hypothetical protein
MMAQPKVKDERVRIIVLQLDFKVRSKSIKKRADRSALFY